MRPLFKGVMSPIISNAPVYAVIFASNELCKRVMKDWNRSEDFKVFWAGFMGGLVSVPIVCPAEQMKIRRQVRQVSYTDIIFSEGKFLDLISTFRHNWALQRACANILERCAQLRSFLLCL